MNISKHNTRIFKLTWLFHSLIFTIPIWIVFYQQRITPAQISVLVTFQYIAQMALELPSGALADLIGRRKTIIVGSVVGAISYLLFPFASSFTHYMILAFLIGVSDSFRSGSEEAILYDSYKEEKNEKKYDKAYADANIIYQVGLIIATALGGLIFEYNNTLPYTFYGIALVIVSILSYFYLEPSIDSDKFTLANYRKQIIDGSKEAFKTQYTKYLSLFYIFVGGIAWASTLYFNAYMMVDLGFENDIRGYLTAGMRFLNVVIIAKLLTNKKIFNSKRTILFFPIIMILGYLPGYWLSGYLGLPFVQIIISVTTARWIVLSPLTNAVFSSKYRATAISLLSLLIGFVYISMTGISGLVIPHYGVKAMYSLLGLFSLVTVVPLTYKLLVHSKDD